MDLNEIDYNYLSSMNLFSENTVEEIQEFVTALDGSIKHFSDGERIYQYGQMITKIGIVIKGSVMVRQNRFDGKELIFAEFREQMIFGSTYCFLEKINAHMDYVSRNDSVVLMLSINKIFETENSDSIRKIYKNMFRSLARNFYIMSIKINIITQPTLQDKILSFLNFYQTEVNQNPFKLPFTREQIANYMNADRSAVSRELTRMEKKGLLKIDGKQITLAELNFDF